MTLRTDRGNIVLWTFYVLGVCVLLFQPLRTLLQPGFQGVLFKGGDESQYIMRINEAMLHPWTDVSNPYVSGPQAPRGLQMTLLETVAGSLFSWTGFTAPMLAILLSSLIAPLTLPLWNALALRLGATKVMALSGAVLYFFLLLGPLRRIVHQAWSLPLVLATLVLIVDWWRSPTRGRSLVTGCVLGILPGVYFWAWSFGWASFGILAVCTACVEWRGGRAVNGALYLRRAVMTGVTALLVASPFLYLQWINSLHPAAADAALQSSLVHARGFESVPRSALLILLFAASTIGILRTTGRRKLLPLFAFQAALVLVLHQQFIHGIALSFWTHYYPYVCAAAMLVIVVFLSALKRGRVANVAIILASVFLLGAFVDYKGRLAVFTPIPNDEKYQHLAVPLQSLRAEKETQTILTDRETALIVGTYTHHDVVYTSFIRHTLIDFAELAERYCLTQLITGGEPETEWLAGDVYEHSALGRQEAAVINERNLHMTAEACDRIQKDPKNALRKYGVTMVLWDERNYPDWKLPLKLLEKTEAGAGYSLWRVR